MRLMSPAHAQVMNQLVRLACRDDRLVDAALKHCVRADGTADILAVMDFIKRHRVAPIPTPKPAGQAHPTV